MPANDALSDSSRAWLVTLLSMLAVGLLAFLLYSRALDFAFFNDDPTGHFAWMETRDYGDYFRTSADYGYYRPVVFVILQGLVDSIAYNARLFHALLLGLHAANAALLWLLSWRLSDSRSYAWATALIFTFAPFNYEAVAYVASLTHPLLLFWLLLTLLLYQQAGRMGQIGRQAAAFILYGLAMSTFVLGLLTHENGLFIPLAIAGVEWLERPPSGLVDSLKRPFLPYLVLTPIFLIFWWSIPKTSEQVLPSLSTWTSNLAPFLQTLVYPLLPLVRLTAWQTTALWILTFLALFLTFLAARVARAVGLWLFGLGWFLFSALPATLFLSPAYLYGSPRLHYLPVVGVAILWAMPVLALAHRLPEPPWERLAEAAVGLVYTAAIILPPLFFIDCEMDFYEEASRIARQMGSLGEEAADGRELLFVNVPVFFSSYAAHPQGCENPYPWTPVGAVLLPDYANARDFVRFNGGPDRAGTAVSVDAYVPGWRTYGASLTAIELRARLADSAVAVFDLTAGVFSDLSAVWLLDSAGETEPVAVFGNKLQLHAAGVAPANDSHDLLVTLTWQIYAAGDRETPLAVFTHLYDQDGRLVAQHDGPPADNLVPRGWWQAQDLVIDTHRIQLDDQLPPGSYKVGVGVYDPQTGERYVARSGVNPLTDNIFIAAEFILP